MDTVSDLFVSLALALFANGFSGGGERALFEARACGAQVEVADDNSKLQARQPLVGSPFHIS